MWVWYFLRSGAELMGAELDTVPPTMTPASADSPTYVSDHLHNSKALIMESAIRSWTYQNMGEGKNVLRLVAM